MSRRPHKPAGDTPDPSPKRARGRGRGQGHDNGSRRELYHSYSAPGGILDSISNKEHGKSSVPWTKEETAAIVKYVALYHTVEEGKQWPTSNFLASELFWKNCGKFVSEETGKPARPASGCRSHMMRNLKTKFSTVHEAEDHFNITYSEDTQPKENLPPTSNTPVYSIPAMKANFRLLTESQQWDFLESLYHEKLEELRPSLSPFVPRDFLKLCASGMETLCTNGRENTLYHLAHALGTPREDGSGPRMPVDRMPFPMLEYNAKFFSVEYADLLQCPKEYAAYQETMYAHFGNKWSSLHSGPMWSGLASIEEGKEDEEEDCGIDGRKKLLRLASLEQEVDVLAEAMKEICSDLGVAPMQENSTSVERSTNTSDLGVVPMQENSTSVERSTNTSLPWLDVENWEAETVPSAPVTSTPLKSTHDSSASEHTRSYSFYFSWATQSDRREAQEGLPLDQLQKLHHIQPTKQTKSRARLKTMDAKVNVAGVSSRNLRRKISKTDFTCDTSIQVSMLKQAHASNPDGRWWVKADACDLKQGLRESMTHEWSGDTDLGGGQLQEAEAKYKSQQIFVLNLGLRHRSHKEQLSKDLVCLLAIVRGDKEFLENGLKEKERVYARKKTEVSASADTLFTLGWELDSYKKLLVVHAELIATMESMLATVMSDKPPGGLRQLREQLKWYLKGVSTQKREAASHLLIFMISDEGRNKKPYAVPVRILPCRVVKDEKMRRLKDEIKTTMEAIGMVVVGFVTDGEWNSLRTRGNHRPVSIIQVMMDAKAEARGLTAPRIREYLTLREDPANPLPVVGHEAVPLEDVVWLSRFMRENNQTFEKAIHILRRTHFPFMYDPHPWTLGRMNETTADCLKSIMATYIFRKKVNDFNQTGVDFSHKLYVPEVGEGNEPHFDREDHGHVLKRLTACVRIGNVPSIELRRWVEAMQSPDTGLTYTALTGKRKQSVADCERMFSVGVVNFFESKGYISEKRFAETVLNWHKATDGRGLKPETREKNNKDMLAYILEDWMPYHSLVDDYAMMDVNRPIKGIQGLTREVVVALLCNIESQEERRNMVTTRGLPPEHPRAGTSDDVEAFIATLHGMLGPIFDHKAFRDNYRKILHEYAKRLDRDLPYWYHTGINERFQLELPSFDQPSGQTERLDRIRESRFADPGIDNPCRVHMPRRGVTTIRSRLHNRPEELPPPPQA